MQATEHAPTRSFPVPPATASNGRPGGSVRAVSRPDVATVVEAGITAGELADHLPRRNGTQRLTAPALQEWLLDAGLARLDGGLLRPTRRAIEAAAGLT